MHKTLYKMHKIMHKRIKPEAEKTAKFKKARKINVSGIFQPGKSGRKIIV